MIPVDTLLRRSASRILTPIAHRAARRYIAGPEIADALRFCTELSRRGFPVCVGYWNEVDEPPRKVADNYVAAVDALTPEYADAYLSIKLPALEFSTGLANEVFHQSEGRLARVHFDSLGPETVDDTWSAIEQLDRRGVTLGCTLPARWRRSVEDAGWAVDQGLVVRIVKGQWADSDGRDSDPDDGFLNVVDRLAGCARHVAVATHDVPLAREAIRRLQASGTSHELELLYGLPATPCVQLAQAAQVPVRFYVPYGTAYLPYALSRARRQPMLLWWLFKDAMVSASRRLAARNA